MIFTTIHNLFSLIHNLLVFLFKFVLSNIICAEYFIWVVLVFAWQTSYWTPQHITHEVMTSTDLQNNTWNMDWNMFIVSLNSKQDINTRALGDMLRKETSREQDFRDTINKVLQVKILAGKLIHVYAYIE